ncbi:MAG: MurR/RpiR family transcriptional regulator [Deltaproteobacteria bacterium]|nr:MurR/RpiR family transcriptional regulator [Deltaproteobacteria bacterium]MBW1955691.1 MurR/RpiR family transcriptional regulator [Deltaproteobacteria bacterium]MBW2041180.1 MurR/RpiR family transcriptional regulator [Deltaproteobacteria bacterium]
MHQEENSLLRIRRLLPYLNPALKRVGQYALKNSDEIKTLKIKELAAQCDVSEATITRFVKKIGLNSYQNFKISVAEISPENASEARSEEKHVYDDVNKDDPIEIIANKIIFRNIEAMEGIKKLINFTEMQKAVDAINKTDLMVFYCVGSSTIAAESAKMRFYRIGKQCILYNDPAHLAVSSSLLTKGNIAIGISNSGSTIFTVNALKAAKENGATTICITNYDDSPITLHSDIKLFTATKQSSFFQESLVSRAAQILMVDILYACCASKNYDNSIKLLEKSAAAIKKALH